MRKVDLHPKTDTFIMDFRNSSFFSVEKINAGYFVKMGDYASCIEILILIFNRPLMKKIPSLVHWRISTQEGSWLELPFLDSRPLTHQIGTRKRATHSVRGKNITGTSYLDIFSYIFFWIFFLAGSWGVSKLSTLLKRNNSVSVYTTLPWFAHLYTD